jgi:acetyl/propionyl-CoA carboxylase alpha subunit/acetyl-CoA carboxylase carboxyltransferase component
MSCPQSAGSTLGRLLIANRGEVAIRIARACAEAGIETVAVYAGDDADCPHRDFADQAVALPGFGAPAYLDIEALIAAALASGCKALHPGYGFVSERAELARACEAAGIVFVGPRPETLELFGDKVSARALAQQCGVPVLAGTPTAASLEQARAFLKGLGAGAALMIKAVAGGGGRGMRIVRDEGELAPAYERCRSEALAAFGVDAVYVEQALIKARHLEVQIVGDGQGGIVALGERECSLQRRHQKVVEIAPSPTLAGPTRAALMDAALAMARAVNYRGLGTFEFLLADDGHRFAFIEANARLQVEHTVTEAVTGVDLVRAQLEIAAGATLAQIGLDPRDPPTMSGHAIQLRINMERLGADGQALAVSGRLSAFEPPGGPGVRIDTYARIGLRSNPGFDSLLAKLIVHSRSPVYADVLAKARRALGEFQIEGVPTNREFLLAVLAHPDLSRNAVWTQWIESEGLAWVAGEGAVFARPPQRASSRPSDDASVTLQAVPQTPVRETLPQPDGTVAIICPMPGRVVALCVAEGDSVRAGEPVAIVSSMKMEHEVPAPVSGVVQRCAFQVGDVLDEGAVIGLMAPMEDAPALDQRLQSLDLDEIRPDLAESIERHAFGLDENRPQAVQKRRRTGQRTARENLADLIDEGSFIEYGPLVIAAQRSRRTLEDLRENTPGDGMVAGLATVNASLFDAKRAGVVAMSYDYTVLAGTQGWLNHKKKDRLFELAQRLRLPVVLFAEGGGGRPGDVDMPIIAGLDCLAFQYFAGLSGLVPLLGIVSGRCFAGNAALLGCCDVIIATKNASIGMGGPAMIEGAGLGEVAPDEVGPTSVMGPNGVIDVLVDDEAQAVAAARKYLSYFQGALDSFEAADPRELRHLIPQNRVRAYDVRTVIHTLSDRESVLEVRPQFGVGIITALVRIGGRPMGLIANNPQHLGGAIDAPAGDKAARFMQLCDAFDLPILSLCDTPGFMVGPQAERQATVRHVARMFVVAASLTVPVFTVVLRKGYGLGAQAMAAGGFHAPVFTVGWPSSEFGGMGLEGAVRLGFRKELQAQSDPALRQALFDQLLAQYYERGKGVNMASMLEIDDVIDPAQTRHWILRGLDSVPPPAARSGKKRPCVDTW